MGGTGCVSVGTRGVTHDSTRDERRPHTSLYRTPRHSGASSTRTGRGNSARISPDGPPHYTCLVFPVHFSRGLFDAGVRDPIFSEVSWSGSHSQKTSKERQRTRGSGSTRVRLFFEEAGIIDLSPEILSLVLDRDPTKGLYGKLDWVLTRKVEVCGSESINVLRPWTPNNNIGPGPILTINGK